MLSDFYNLGCNNQERQKGLIGFIDGNFIESSVYQSNVKDTNDAIDALDAVILLSNSRRSSATMAVA